MKVLRAKRAVLVSCFLLMATKGAVAEDWLQFKYDCRHSGNVPDRSITVPLGLVGAVPLTDAVFTAPVVADEHVYIMDGSGVVFCIDASNLRVLWKFDTGSGKANCNNVSSPAVTGRFLHIGTMAGSYFVLDRRNGEVVRKIACGEPILTAPVVANGRVYFATLGSRVYALEPDGAMDWTWDFVKEVLGFDGDRWSGKEWCEHKDGRVTWRDQFCCSVNMVVDGKTLVIPAGGSAVCLEDAGGHAELRGMATVPSYAGSE